MSVTATITSLVQSISLESGEMENRIEMRLPDGSHIAAAVSDEDATHIISLCVSNFSSGTEQPAETPEPLAETEVQPPSLVDLMVQRPIAEVPRAYPANQGVHTASIPGRQGRPASKVTLVTRTDDAGNPIIPGQQEMVEPSPTPPMETDDDGIPSA